MRNTVLLGLLLTAGCHGSTDPELGTLEIAITTVGGDLDLDGYQLRIDGGPPGFVGLVATIRLEQYPAGPHAIELLGLDGNCDLSRGPLHDVVVRHGEVTRVEFQVICYPTGVTVIARTEGLDFDLDGYTVAVGDRPPEIVGANGSLTIGRLTGGNAYQVRVGGIAANCSALGQPVQTIPVTFRQTALAEFQFACTATSGVVAIEVTTSGDDPDPDGYEIWLDGGPTKATGVYTTARFSQIPAGIHTVEIDALATNCVPGDQPSRQQAQVTVGGLTRDTARIRFDVRCVRTDKIAAMRGSEVVVLYADGSHQSSIGQGRGSPSWAPAGAALVWEGIECAYGWYYYYYSYCSDRGLFIAGADGSQLRVLTSMSTDREPAWSPDGSTIAFTRDGALALISPEGAGLRGLATPASMVEEPAWAPDGTELAFTCVVEPDNYDICRIRLDGSGFTRLTSDSTRDRTPAWSPDGTRIAFTTTRFGPFESVAHMATDGTDLIGITDGRSPSWSPDGEQLVYERPGRGLSTIRRDGTGRFTVSGGAETAPAWRP